jgi:hypothetical protein
VTDGKAFPGRRGVKAAGASAGFRGAALNQSRSASGVYTGLICYTSGIQEVLHVAGEKCGCGA